MEHCKISFSSLLLMPLSTSSTTPRTQRQRMTRRIHPHHDRSPPRLCSLSTVLIIIAIMVASSSSVFAYRSPRPSVRGVVKGPQRSLSSRRTSTTAAAATVRQQQSSTRGSHRVIAEEEGEEEEAIPRGLSSHRQQRRHIQANKNGNMAGAGADCDGGCVVANQNKNDKGAGDDKEEDDDVDTTTASSPTSVPTMKPGPWISVPSPTDQQQPSSPATTVVAATTSPTFMPVSQPAPAQPAPVEQQQQQQTEQPSPTPLPLEHSLPLVFSLWLGIKKGNSSIYTTMTNVSEARLERARNPIHVSVVESLWQFLCTLASDDIEFAEQQETTTTTSFCDTFLEDNDLFVRRKLSTTTLQQQQRLVQEENNNSSSTTSSSSSSSSILLQTPFFVNVENRFEQNVAWTEWKTIFYVQRIGNAYIEMALQNNPELVPNVAAVDATIDDGGITANVAAVSTTDSSSSTNNSTGSTLLLDRAAVEIMRETLQLHLDIAMLDGSMDEVLQERLRINTMNATTTDEVKEYMVLSSPLGGELEAFPVVVIPDDNTDDDDDDNETTTTTDDDVGDDDDSSAAATEEEASDSNLVPNTFEYSVMSAQRISGIVLFIVSVFGYVFMLISSKKRRKRLDQLTKETAGVVLSGGASANAGGGGGDEEHSHFLGSLAHVSNSNSMQPQHLPAAATMSMTSSEVLMSPYNPNSSAGRRLPSLLGSGVLISGGQMSDSDLSSVAHHDDILRDFDNLYNNDHDSDDHPQLALPRIFATQSYDDSVEVSPRHASQSKPPQQQEQHPSSLALPQLHSGKNDAEDNPNDDVPTNSRHQTQIKPQQEIQNQQQRQEQPQGSENEPNQATANQQQPTQSAASFFGDLDKFFLS